MKNLVVKSASTTVNDRDSNGSISLYCEVDGIAITIRTTVLYDENGNVVTQDLFVGKTIDVKGVISMYKVAGTAEFPYQIKVLSLGDITIHQ